MSDRLDEITEQFRWALANLSRPTANLDNDDVEYLIKQNRKYRETLKYIAGEVQGHVYADTLEEASKSARLALEGESDE